MMNNIHIVHGGSEDSTPCSSGECSWGTLGVRGAALKTKPLASCDGVDTLTGAKPVVRKHTQNNEGHKKGPDTEEEETPNSLINLLSGKAGRDCRLNYRRKAAQVRFMTYIRWLQKIIKNDGDTTQESENHCANILKKVWTVAKKVAKKSLELKRLSLSLAIFFALLLAFQGIEPNPGPQNKNKAKEKKIALNVLSWNCDSLSDKERQRKVTAWAHDNKIDVLLLQETRIENREELHVRTEGNYTFYCSPCSGQKYGTAIAVHNSINDSVISAQGFSDRHIEIQMIEPGYPDKGKSPCIIRIQSVYGPQDLQRTPKGERERKQFWCDIDKSLQIKNGNYRTLNIVGTDCNGRLAPGSTEVGQECLHDEFTKNGHSVLELMINNRMRAVNTHLTTRNGVPIQPRSKDGKAKASELATFTTARVGHQIDYVLASKSMAIRECELVKNLHLREDVRAGHLPIYCRLEYRRYYGEEDTTKSGGTKNKGPMDMNYCPQKLRAGIHKWRAATAVKEIVRTPQQKQDYDHLNNYVKDIEEVRDANPVQENWEQALQKVEEVTAKYFPKKTVQEARAERAVMQGNSCQKSQTTASLEDQISRETEKLLDTRKQISKEICKEAFRQWAARCKAVSCAERRFDRNNKLEYLVEFEEGATGTYKVDWAKDSELKWVPNENKKLMNTRCNLLQKGWFIKTKRERLRADLKRSERTDRNSYYDNLCKHVEEGDTIQEKINRTWQLVKKLNGKNKNSRTSKLTAIESDSGPKIMPQDKANAFGEFLTKSFREESQNMLSGEEWDQVTERTIDSLPETATLTSISKNTREKLESPITKEEIVEAIKGLKKGKAISTDHMCSEMLALDPEGWATWLLPAINNLDPSTQTGRVIFLYKGKGSVSDRSNYRPISILSPIYKIWTTVQTKRCNAIVDDIASCWQFGFRRNRGCREALYSVQALISRSAHKNLSLAMLDLSKAFDKANRKKLFKKMVEFGAPKSFVDQIRRGHMHTKLTACFEGKYSEPVQIQKGVYQGSPLSPVLYVLYAHSIYLDFQEEAMKQGLEQVKLVNEAVEEDSDYLALKEDQMPKNGDHRIPMICYADDTNLVAPDMDTLGKAIDIFNKVLDQHNMQCNKGKTKILTREKLTNEQKKQFAGEVLQVSDEKKLPEIFVDNARFLGSLVNIQGYSHQACVERANEGRKLGKALSYTFFKNEHISKENKMRVYNAVFGAVLLYGVDAYNYSENDLQDIQTLQNKILRGIYEGKGPPPAERDEKYYQNRTKNEDIQSDLGAPSAKTLVERARLRFWGSLNRGGKLLSGAVLIHKLKLDEETTAAVKIQRRRQLNEQFDTRQKQIDVLMHAFNERFMDIKETVMMSEETEKWRYPVEVAAAGDSELTKQDHSDIKAIIHIEETEVLRGELYQEHHCTKSIARTSDNIRTIFANVQNIKADTPSTMSENHWKRLTNWVVSTQAKNPADQTQQIKYKCEGCKREFRDLFTHFQHVAAARKKEDACIEIDCIQHYTSKKDPKIPIPTADLATEDQDVEMDVEWRTHPHRFICPMGLKSCKFPAPKLRWCIICRERENFVPNANKSEIRNKITRNAKAKEFKACTGKVLVPHSGKIELSCPKKLKTCRYPDVNGWWCKNCVDRSGKKPLANLERERKAQERKKRKSPHADQDDLGINAPQKKMHKGNEGLATNVVAISIDKTKSDKKRPSNPEGQPENKGGIIYTRSHKKRQRDSSSQNAATKGDNKACPKGLKSCQYPTPKRWWCKSCKEAHSSKPVGILNAGPKQVSQSNPSPKGIEDLQIVGGASSRHRILGRSSQQSNNKLKDGEPTSQDDTTSQGDATL